MSRDYPPDRGRVILNVTALTMLAHMQNQVAWDRSLAVGNAEIDAQHRLLFEHFARLVAAMDAGRSADVGTLFRFLAQYAIEHFGAEERLMDEVRFPGAGVHKAAHARFVRELAELLALHEANGPSRAIAVKTRTWIGGWLRSHIMGADLAFGSFLNGP